MTIYDYFNNKLGYAPDDETLRELPVDSGCGDACKAAIDAASELLYHARQAGGYAHGHVFEAINEIVSIYWRG